MNEANDFYEDMRSRHQAVLSWRDNNSAPPSSASEGAGGGETGGGGADEPGSGNGVGREGRKTGQTRDGIKSISDPKTNLSPNG
jgi:autophagy-related protein 16-1